MRGPLRFTGVNLRPRPQLLGSVSQRAFRCTSPTAGLLTRGSRSGTGGRPQRRRCFPFDDAMLPPSTDKYSRGARGVENPSPALAKSSYFGPFAPLTGEIPSSPPTRYRRITDALPTPRTALRSSKLTTIMESVPQSARATIERCATAKKKTPPFSGVKSVPWAATGTGGIPRRYISARICWRRTSIDTFFPSRRKCQ